PCAPRPASRDPPPLPLHAALPIPLPPPPARGTRLDAPRAKTLSSPVAPILFPARRPPTCLQLLTGPTAPARRSSRKSPPCHDRCLVTTSTKRGKAASGGSMSGCHRFSHSRESQPW